MVTWDEIKFDTAALKKKLSLEKNKGNFNLSPS